eukprot:TRINITY_DN2837_c0_g1_i1.p1 TRINITY_DN2837_c0_g1~~TRINITY_DN2837_c0_g1_i1.p1  ORF type:complete len:299 (-),score=124.55 TRINITY_DN2837_c0_g1_i1:54-950(-)
MANLLLVFVLLYWYNSWFLNFIAFGLFVAWSYWSSRGPLRRRIQLATWKPSSEGNIYCKVSLDASKVVEWLKKQKEKGNDITLTHIVGKATAVALKNAPSLNGSVLFDRFIEHKTVDISFLAMIEGGKNLAKIKVESADKKLAIDISNELRSRVDKLRKGKDEEFKKSMTALQNLPTWAIRLMLHNLGWLSGCLGVDFKAVGVERFPFGAAMVTSVGMLGIDEAYAPFTPFAHVPLLVLIGQLKDGIVVVDKQPLVRPKVKITTTVDHRFLDGAQGGVLIKKLKEIFDNPELLEKESF